MSLIGRNLLSLVVPCILALQAGGAEQDTPNSFQKVQLSDQFFGEGAHFGDFNHDGAMDVVSGPYWYAGPDFTDRHEYYAAKPFDINGYSDAFFAFTHDVNGDGWTDILIVGFPGQEAWWFANPQGKPGHWPRHVAVATVDNESPTLTDVTGDGRPDLVCSAGGQLGYAEIPNDDPAQPWQFHPITPQRDYQRFTHGLGVGDVNGDGRQDILEKDGWWEQPPADSDTEFWTLHEHKFSAGGGAQMYAYDVDGDGDNDVVTSKAAHAYGLSWFENVAGADHGITFNEHVILGESAEANESGVAFSQLHALALADMNGDGVPDIVTGKRFWAHNGNDPGARDPAVLYWFETQRGASGARFVPHRVDVNSGVGTEVVTGDLNGDARPDIVVGNKKGTFVFLQLDDSLEPDRSSPNSSLEQGGEPDGHPATDASGRVLNLDFEKGDLSDWTATGTAFEAMPVRGDTVHVRRADSVSGHRGKYWVGTFERKHDGPQGTLTSMAFSVTHPYASFRVGGGSGGALRVEIVRSDTNDVVFSASGRSQEEMRPVVADLRELVGKEIFLRIVDQASAGWGHINFDHFRFHDDKPAFEETTDALRADEYPFAGLPAEEAARVMKVPDGFSVVVSAAEPDVKQPIAMAYDDRGRLWIAEAYEYPVRAPEGEGRDRILIFEDADGDGRFDKRTVFKEGLNLVSGLEVGFGGVWVGAAPYLMFIPDRNGDDTPDGEPEILLDGWAWQDTHETLNTFIWGPDGWLYGCHGVFTHSLVGKPGTPDADRVPLNAAIWRYHPTRHLFEVFAEGTSNPWGVDFDDRGQAFSTACVIPHLYHVFPGGRYQRQAGSHFNPYTYADIQTIADHRHFVGDNPHGGNGVSDDAGGGHAHAGAMIYLGGAWPDEYRGRIFMNNIHGQRLNTDILKPHGSGFVGSHGPDFLLTGDLASQILNIRYGPDGNAFFIDWYDTNACHHNNVEGHDRTNGRVYKVIYGKPQHVRVDLSKRSDLELAEMVLENNDWYVRHARRILQERAATKIDENARERLLDIAIHHADATRRLRAMWALHVSGGLSPDLIPKLLHDKEEYVRAWTIQLAMDVDSLHFEDLIGHFIALAHLDPSPIVRRYIASALQKAPLGSRVAVLDRLTEHAEDADDPNLPLMYWYALEPLVEPQPQAAIRIAMSPTTKIPLLKEFVMRRAAARGTPEALSAALDAIQHTNSAGQVAALKSLRRGLEGQRRIAPPGIWSHVFDKLSRSENAEVRNQATALGVAFGDPAAIEAMRHFVASPNTDVAMRREALEALLAAKDPGLPATLQELLDEPALRGSAIAGLAMYDDSDTPARLLEVYASLSPPEKRAALATLTSRSPYGQALLKAVVAKRIPTSDLPADLVRQLHNLKNDEIDAILADIWGHVRSTAEDKAELIAHYRELIAATQAVEPDPQLGRAVFAKTCQQCHTLYGVGEKIGPDLTGSNRADAEYLLSNIVDPSALIAKEYQSTVIITVDGRVITGIVTAEDDNSVTVRTATEAVVIPQDEIDERELSDTSMMPDDQLKQFSPHEVLSLFAYLRGKSQAPMLATKESAALLFNGRDLAGWSGDSQLWSVANGEIVGRSRGIEHNSFLLSDLSAGDFRLSFEVKLVEDEGNSGVQFRSLWPAFERPATEMFHEIRGYQADIGPGWWGKLYEENGRALLWDKSGEGHVKRGEWNRYKIEAVGSRVRTWLNGQPCVDLDDPEGRRRGVFALQIHAGGPMEVRFRNLQLEVTQPTN